MRQKLALLLRKISEVLVLCWPYEMRRVRKAEPTVTQHQSAQTEKAPIKREGTSSYHAELNVRIREFLFSRYEFRYNVLTEQLDFRPIKQDGTPQAFQFLDKRMVNSMVIETQSHGVECWDKDVERLLRSRYVESYHPFYAYMDELPAWDGKDRILDLALRVDDHPVWISGFHKWLLGLTAQWMGMYGRCANTLTPILISSEQGRSKSTFCRLLMPPELRYYYTDKFDLNAKANMEIKLGQFGLINLDEFNRYSNTALATLKNLLQLKKLTVKKAYTSYFQQLDRIASFIGTSNQMDLLNDPTGSRRFLCVEVKKEIDCSPIAYRQLFAQLKQEILEGERAWMNHDEEKELQEHNLMFARLRPEEEVFHQIYSIPEKEGEGSFLTTTEIHRALCKKFPSEMRGIGVQHLGCTLAGMGLKKVHSKVGNKYGVVVKPPKADGECKTQ